MAGVLTPEMTELCLQKLWEESVYTEKSQELGKCRKLMGRKSWEKASGRHDAARLAVARRAASMLWRREGEGP